MGFIHLARMSVARSAVFLGKDSVEYEVGSASHLLTPECLLSRSMYFFATCHSPFIGRL